MELPALSIWLPLQGEMHPADLDQALEEEEQWSEEKEPESGSELEEQEEDDEEAWQDAAGISVGATAARGGDRAEGLSWAAAPSISDSDDTPSPEPCMDVATAAQYIQRWWRAQCRGAKVQRDFCQLRVAAVRLQSAWRSNLLRRAYREERHDSSGGPESSRESSRQLPPLLAHLTPPGHVHQRNGFRLAGDGCLQEAWRMARRPPGSPEKRVQRTSGGSPQPSPCGKSSSQLSPCRRVFTPPPRRLTPPPQRVSMPATPVSLQSNPRLLLADLFCCGVLSSDEQQAWPTEAPATSDLAAVRQLLAAALPAVQVHMVARVKCKAIAVSAYSAVCAALGPERLMWHGTSWESVSNIACHGFNRVYAYEGKHGARLGRGTYFAEDPAYALRFAGRAPGPRALFLAGVLPGRVTRGADGLIEPPLADTAGTRFDSTADNPANPRVLCVFRDFQALPLFLVELV